MRFSGRGDGDIVADFFMGLGDTVADPRRCVGGGG